MSLNTLLNIVPVPEISKLIPVDLKPVEKPAEDFLAVLDRALAERRQPEPVDKTETVPPAETTRQNTNTQPEASFAAAMQVRPEEHIARNQSGHDVQTVSKTANTRIQDGEFVRQVPRENNKATPKFLDEPGLARAPIDKRLNPETAEGRIKKNTDVQPTLDTDQLKPKAKPIRKPGLDSEAVQNRLSEKAPVDTKQNVAIKTREADSRSDAAQRMLQLDGGNKGLQDALSLVQDLAKKFNISPNQSGHEQAVSINRSIELSRTPAAPKQTTSGKNEMVESSGDSRKTRAELAKADKTGRAGAIADLKQANENGKVQILDLRGQAYKPSLVLENMLAEAAHKVGSGRADDNTKKDSLNLINTSFFNPAVERNTVSIPVHLTTSQQGNIQQALKSHLERQGNSDIVSQARIVMNGHESGEIKLILKPENLGEVRIHLQMQDGHIDGKIFVENKEVQAVFQDNLQELLQAFKDGGLSTGDMQVTVDGRGAEGFARQFSDGNKDKQPDERQKLHAVRSFEQNVATVAASDGAYSQINLVV